MKIVPIREFDTKQVVEAPASSGRAVEKSSDKQLLLGQLRQKLARLEGRQAREKGAIETNAGIDHSPFRDFLNHHLCLTGLHEVRGHDLDQEEALLPALFTLGLALHWKKTPILISHRGNFHAPGLLRLGFNPSGILFVSTRNNKDTLWAFEESLRLAGAAFIIAELEKISLLESRRLQLAAEKSGASGWAIRRWRLGKDAKEHANQPISALSRWHVQAAPAPSSAFPSAKDGAPFRLDLWRHRGGKPRSWQILFYKGTFHEIPLPLAQSLPDRSLALA